jgi:diaminopimelate epimerase
MLKFCKYHSSGNSFIIIDQDDLANQDRKNLVQRLCDVHNGVGADGLLIVKKNPLTMEIYNQDGSLATMCGNGLMCFTKYAYDHHWIEEVDEEYPVMTKAGEYLVKISVLFPFTCVIKWIKPSYNLTSFGLVQKEKETQTLHYLGNDYEFTFVDTGCKHGVCFTKVSDITENIANALQQDKTVFSEPINLDFVEMQKDNHAISKTYERGVGFTKACGTGAVAIFEIAKKNGFVQNDIYLDLEYGEIHVFEKENDIYMQSNVTRIMTGEF